jgi:hypothetical protein
MEEQKTTDLNILKVDSDNPSFGAVDLDHKMTKRDGMQVAKEILAVNPCLRIIFFILCLYHGSSWFYGKAVEASCRLMQKPRGQSDLRTHGETMQI